MKELVHRAEVAGIRGASIRIIGGAALRIAHFHREATVDIDARIKPWDELEPIVRVIAAEHSWPENWLNTNASQFIPHLGKTVEWVPLYETEAVVVSVAAADAMLAMKLLALGRRRGRDAADVAQLLVLNKITSVEAAEQLFEEFYPGDALDDEAIRALEHIFEVGLPDNPSQEPDQGPDGPRT
ncbi:nucleotidyl transferase AbiEii/AbiGii toxin family protein [Homoserinimonas sp. OAct 916]|uniref:nucleotidyl transferase AbiEii/AbiGii toxin family protein n=1 Tax=Homoserinimonas sp. OAct 916 TaxID=2211450 RepID=UPI00130086DB|nr:nucleotidyl transferase AbiEii/AbiGii toxin family protein [Homoserinimonas sp. OAct 916]